MITPFVFKTAGSFRNTLYMHTNMGLYLEIPSFEADHKRT